MKTSSIDITGTTLECFHDLMKQMKQLSSYYEKRKQLALILGVEDQTIRRWLQDSGMPVGMSMISLRYYLEHLGYEVSEIRQLPEVINQVGRLLAFRVLGLEAMAKLTGFPGSPDQVFTMLRRGKGFSEVQIFQLQNVLTAHRKELVDALNKVPKLVVLKQHLTPSATKRFGDPSSNPHAVILPAVAALPQEVKANHRREERFKCLALNLLDFAQSYTNSEVPEEVRDRLRSVVGQQNIFDLKNLLSRLCSSNAFNNQQ